MNKSTSTYLDFLRVFSAFGVLITHAMFPWFSTLVLHPKDDIGNKLVMIFFVLSGYLISYTVDSKNKGPRIYLVDRFSRLYSVILPALILTFVLDTIGSHYNPAGYLTKMAHDHQVVRYLLNITFMGQSWGLCTIPSTNAPFWSICYEFWYYMIFWVWIYLKGFWKVAAFVFICALIGIKIILLLPVWVFGVIAYHYSNKPKYALSKNWATALFVTTFITIAYFIFFDKTSFFSKEFPYGHQPLYYSANFLANWIYGVVVAVNIWSFSFIAAYINIPAVVDKIVKKISSVTFSLYLYHVPMLIFAGALIPYDKGSYLQVGGVSVGIILIIVLLSEITENQRQYFKIVIQKIFFAFGKKEDIKISS